MSIPKEPRQQMINIMYLVLTALLALNVSAEILHAFKILNKSINHSNQSMNEKLDEATASFQSLKSKTPKAIVYEPFVNESLRIGDQAIQFIDQLQEELIAASNGPKHAGFEIRKAEDQSTPTRIMITEGKAEQLRTRLNESRTSFAEIFSLERRNEHDEALFDEGDSKEFLQSIPLTTIPEMIEADGKQVKWEDKLFKQMPMAATITLLNKYKNDLISTQATSIEKLYRVVSKDDEPFDQYTVGLVPSGKRFIQGEPYSAEIFLAASRSSSRPVIKVNGRELTVNDKGRAQHDLARLNELGKKTFEYTIEYKNSFGEEAVKTGVQEISVVPPPDHVAIASPTQMNILYIGLANPIAASITGIPDDKVHISLDQGNLEKTGPGTYDVSVNTPGISTMSFTGENLLGEQISLQREFRVMRIPDPKAVIDKRTGGNMRTGKWKAQRAVFANLDFFPFKTRFEIVGFEMTHARAKDPDIRICTNQGGQFKGQCLIFQKEAEVGDRYYLDNIRAKGPDGKVRTLNAISFKMI